MFTSDATSPNGNFEADDGVNLIAHELMEMQNDPLGVGWYDSLGFQSEEKCAWKFGPTTTLANGAQVNQTWDNVNWLVQLNWSNKINGCAQQNATDGPYDD